MHYSHTWSLISCVKFIVFNSNPTQKQSGPWFEKMEWWAPNTRSPKASFQWAAIAASVTFQPTTCQKEWNPSWRQRSGQEPLCCPESSQIQDWRLLARFRASVGTHTCLQMSLRLQGPESARLSPHHSSGISMIAETCLFASFMAPLEERSLGKLTWKGWTTIISCPSSLKVFGRRRIPTVSWRWPGPMTCLLEAVPRSCLWFLNSSSPWRPPSTPRIQRSFAPFSRSCRR